MKSQNLYKIPFWLMTAALLAYLFVWVVISFEFAKFNYKAARLYDNYFDESVQKTNKIDSLERSNMSIKFEFDIYKKRTKYIHDAQYSSGNVKKRESNPFHRNVDIKKSIEDYNKK